MARMPRDRLVTIDREGHVLLMGLNRPAKRNRFNRAMLSDLSRAYGQLDRDPELLCGVLFAHGGHFTGGLDLGDLGLTFFDRGWAWPKGGIDPMGLSSVVSKPVVIAVHGYCLTIGIELMLASDIRVAASDARFAQIEIKRGILPVGGATIRFVRDCGWGNSMRYLLTGDEFDAHSALRMSLVQEVVEPGRQLARAREIASLVAAQAPLAVQATLRNARLAWRSIERPAGRKLLSEIRTLAATEDAREGMQAFVERRQGIFSGR